MYHFLRISTEPKICISPIDSGEGTARRRAETAGGSNRWDRAGESDPTRAEVWGATEQPDIVTTASGRRLRVHCDESIMKGIPLSQYEKHGGIARR